MYDTITMTPSFSKSLQLSGQIVVKSAKENEIGKVSDSPLLVQNESTGRHTMKPDPP